VGNADNFMVAVLILAKAADYDFKQQLKHCLYYC